MENISFIMDEVERRTKTSGTGYPSVDKPWLAYYSEDAVASPLPNMSLYDYMLQQNKGNFDGYAINYFGKRITYRELFQRINQAAKAFRAQGVEEGDIVSVLTVSSIPMVVCYYALNKIGAVVDFVNILSTAKDLVKFFRANHSRVVVSMEEMMGKVLLAARAVGVEKVISFSMNDDLPLAQKLRRRRKSGEEVDRSYLTDEIVLTWDKFIESGSALKEKTYQKDPSKAAVLAHTGGTTGFPKSVLLSDNALNAIAFQYSYIFRGVYKKNAVFLNLVVPFTIYGSLINMHMPLTLGSCVALVPQFNGDDWPEYINKYQPNFITCIPSYMISFMRNPRIKNTDLSCIKVIAVGGDGCSNTLEVGVNKLLKEQGSKARLLKGYGMTELSSSACTTFGEINSLGSVGVPLPKNNICIYDNGNQKECKFNEIGEICFQSPGKMLGYMDNEEEYFNVVRTHPDGSEWLHTGDLGYMNRRGMLHIVGRIKRVILTQYNGVGYRVYPNVVEEILESHPAVREACVVRLHNDTRGRTKAYVALHNHNRVDEAELEKEMRSFCEAEMAAYMRPYIFEFRGALPKTPAGKVDYKLLEQQTHGT